MMCNLKDFEICHATKKAYKVFKGRKMINKRTTKYMLYLNKNNEYEVKHENKTIKKVYKVFVWDPARPRGDNPRN